jgi:hypothetical protein
VLDPVPVIFENSLVVAAAFFRAGLLRCAGLEVREICTFVTGIFPALRCLIAGDNAPFGERGLNMYIESKAWIQYVIQQFHRHMRAVVRTCAPFMNIFGQRDG